jgi:hypothetical protein
MSVSLELFLNLFFLKNAGKLCFIILRRKVGGKESQYNIYHTPEQNYIHARKDKESYQKNTHTLISWEGGHQIG